MAGTGNGVTWLVRVHTGALTFQYLPFALPPALQAVESRGEAAVHHRNTPVHGRCRRSHKRSLADRALLAPPNGCAGGPASTVPTATGNRLERLRHPADESCRGITRTQQEQH